MVRAPLYKDPIYNAPTDPMIIQKKSDGLFYMFYTQRRGNQNVEEFSYVHGTKIGVAESANGADWYYRGALDLEFEFGQNTFWAPEIVYDPNEDLYHMYVSYIRGIYTTWLGRASIEHYTSKDLFYWTRIGTVDLNSDRVIDACLYQLPNGTWRMWYKDECQNQDTCYADSEDLYNWTYRGHATTDCKQEGPNVFELGGKYWLISDVWDGMGVYSSDDCEHFTRQSKNILREPGERCDDNVKGSHADVYVAKGRAYIVYFTQPDSSYPERAVVQMAELKVSDGNLVCDRNADFDVDWI